MHYFAEQLRRNTICDSLDEEKKFEITNIVLDQLYYPYNRMLEMSFMHDIPVKTFDMPVDVLLMHFDLFIKCDKFSNKSTIQEIFQQLLNASVFTVEDLEKIEVREYIIMVLKALERAIFELEKDHEHAKNSKVELIRDIVKTSNHMACELYGACSKIEMLQYALGELIRFEVILNSMKLERKIFISKQKENP